MSEKRNMRVVATNPLDFYYPHTLSLAEWLRNVTACDYRGESGLDVGVECLARLIEATDALTQHPEWATSFGLRDSPRVGYYPTESGDGFFFIFKADNNGTTYLVGDYPPGLEDRCSVDDEETFAVNDHSLAASLICNALLPRKTDD